MGSAYSPVLHCNFECCKIHEFLAFFDRPGHGVQRDSNSKGTVSVDCAKSLGLGFRGNLQEDSDSNVAVVGVTGNYHGRNCYGR